MNKLHKHDYNNRLRVDVITKYDNQKLSKNSNDHKFNIYFKDNNEQIYSM